jgi:iron(III) transport system substrate-binding protein
MTRGLTKSLTMLAFLLSLAPAAWAQTVPNWQKTWDQTLAAAKEEGKLVVVGQPSPAMRNEILPAFTKKYGIPVELIAGQTSTIVGKIRTERGSGIYSADIFMSNASTSVVTLYGEKMLDPLRPLLLRPEVTEGKYWKRGEPYFADPEKEYLLILFSSVDGLLFINSDYVKPEEIRSAKDLLNPKWKGKIATEDPRLPGGSGVQSAVHFYTQLGPEFVKQLYVDQEPVIQRDRRILTDWMARGTQPICLTCHIDDARTLIKEGYKLVEVFELSDMKNRITPTPSLLSFANKAPHPNAARIFVNWMASKEGLELYSHHAMSATLRTDVDESFLDQHIIPQPGKDYVDNTDLDWVAKGQKETADKVRALLKK